MILPSNYNTIEPAYIGESQQLPPGGYICKILSAKEEMSKSNNRMLVLALDIAEGEFKDFYRKKYNAAASGTKWGCAYRQLVEGDFLKYFKGLMTCIEKSNSGYKFTGDEKTLTGKLVGVVFRREQFEGKTGLAFSVKPWQAQTVERIREGVDVPKDKLLNNVHTQNTPSIQQDFGAPPYGPLAGLAEGFMPVESDDDLPF